MATPMMLVANFQRDVVIDQSNKKISGTLHYVDYPDYSSDKEEQSGHYLLLYFDPNWYANVDGFDYVDTLRNVERPIYTKINVELVGGTETIVRTPTIDAKMVIFRITDPKTQKIKVTCFKESSAVYTEIFSLTDMVLEPKA